MVTTLVTFPGGQIAAYHAGVPSEVIDAQRHTRSVERWAKQNGYDTPWAAVLVARGPLRNEVIHMAESSKPLPLPDGFVWESPPPRQHSNGRWTALASACRARPGEWVNLGVQSSHRPRALRKLGLESTTRASPKPGKVVVYTRAQGS
jgi:hypothetical protein